LDEIKNLRRRLLLKLHPDKHGAGPQTPQHTDRAGASMPGGIEEAEAPAQSAQGGHTHTHTHTRTQRHTPGHTHKHTPEFEDAECPRGP